MHSCAHVRVVLPMAALACLVRSWSLCAAHLCRTSASFLASLRSFPQRRKCVAITSMRRACIRCDRAVDVNAGDLSLVCSYNKFWLCVSA